MNDPNLKLLPLDEAVLAATIRDWRVAHPRMGVLALLPEAERERVPLLQSACRAQGVRVVGGIFPELVTSQGFTKSGAWLLRFDEMVPAFLVPDLAADPTAAVARLSDAVDAALAATTSRQPSPPMLYLVVDALLPNISTLLDGLYLRLADRVTYAGVAAGSESFRPMPCVFDGERSIENGALVLLVPSEARTILEHGFEAPEKVMTATSTAGNRIINIDWQPAFDVYRDIVRQECGVELTRENFYRWAARFPFGILRANQEVVVRIPVALTDDGCVFCIGEVPENAMLVVLRAPAVADGKCVSRLARGLEGTIHGPGRRSLVTFYCAGRRLQLGEGAVVELQALQQRTDAAQLAGALSLGELGSTTVGGYPLFHNATLVCTPWPLP